VAFDLPEHRVTAGEAAIYATPNEELDFAKKIVWLMDHPDEREKMGKIGRERIETHLSWAHQKPVLIAAYETVFNHSRRGLFG
jgi:glycosyltransferase involved in cell wall biosynthesis